eukprot:135626-Amphidinium_carterae.1
MAKRTQSSPPSRRRMVDTHRILSKSIEEARSLDLYADRPKTPNGIYSGPELPHAVPLGAPMKQPSGHPPAPQGGSISSTAL